MNKHLPRKAKDIKGPVAIAELRRAHYIITILAVAFAFVVGLVSLFEVQFDPILGATAFVLLILVAIVSLGTALVLSKR